MSIRQRPGPKADSWAWQRLGACRGAASSVFFHPEGGRGNARLRRERRAKELCLGCPVLTQCREHALRVGEPYGIWGGLGEAERAMILKVHGRPRGTLAG